MNINYMFHHYIIIIGFSSRLSKEKYIPVILPGERR